MKTYVIMNDRSEYYSGITDLSPSKIKSNFSSSKELAIKYSNSTTPLYAIKSLKKNLSDDCELKVVEL